MAWSAAARAAAAAARKKGGGSSARQGHAAQLKQTRGVAKTFAKKTLTVQKKEIGRKQLANRLKHARAFVRGNGSQYSSGLKAKEGVRGAVKAARAYGYADVAFHGKHSEHNATVKLYTPKAKKK